MKKRKIWKLSLIPFLGVVGVSGIVAAACSNVTNLKNQAIVPLQDGYQANVTYDGAVNELHASTDSSKPGSGPVSVETLSKYVTLAANLQTSSTANDPNTSFSYSVKDSVANPADKSIEYTIVVHRRTNGSASGVTNQDVEIVGNKLVIDTFPGTEQFNFTPKTSDELKDFSYDAATKELVNDATTKYFSIGTLLKYANLTDTTNIVNANRYRIAIVPNPTNLNINVTLTVLKENFVAKQFTFTLVLGRE
ncbi:hypothetical protein [[Mycoplasma] testudinis]|uniref:hypothetical protein n=1 Tax=[Mycoplasma] testudinis TaxID=33924 RepID=UPI0004858D2D|nr:hypothetical protein [[Mycoplasma] testudinis]